MNLLVPKQKHPTLIMLFYSEFKSFWENLRNNKFTKTSKTVSHKRRKRMYVELVNNQQHSALNVNMNVMDAWLKLTSNKEFLLLRFRPHEVFPLPIITVFTLKISTALFFFAVANCEKCSRPSFFWVNLVLHFVNCLEALFNGVPAVRACQMHCTSINWSANWKHGNYSMMF